MPLKATNDIKIFIVEDDAEQAKLLNDKLIEYNPNYSILKLSSGAELFNYFLNVKFMSNNNYIILDYFLQSPDEKSGLNGIAIIEKIKKLGLKAKIIIYSAYESDDEKKIADLVEDYDNVLDFIKKSPHSYVNIQNVMRFDYAKSTLNRKKRRFQISLVVFAILLALSGLHFLSGYL